MASDTATVVIPGDDPPQIGDSDALERLRQRARLQVYRDRPVNDEEKIRRVRDADVILSSRSAVTWREADFVQLPRLKMIATCSVGTDSIDLDAARSRGIVVSNLPGVNAPFVAEHIFGLMFAVAKRTAEQTETLKAGQWHASLPNVMLQGKRIGIVGTGAIGAEMARLAKGLGMEVVAWTFNPDPQRERELGLRYVSLDELLSTSAVVSLHVRLSEQSTGLIGEAEIAQMRPDAILLNGARGPVVDTAALIAALARGHLHGAGIDVFDQEPLPAGAPITRCERVVLTPHAADQTPEAVHAVNDAAVGNVLAFLDGNPRVNAAQ